MIAPIALFVYKRLDTTIQVLATLLQNKLSSQSDLHIFSDAAKTPADEWGVARVREYVKTINGFASINIHLASKNKGCAKSVIEGVSQILEKHDRIIVLEDDLVVTPNFLDYMNAALDYYQNEKVFSIAGWGMALEHNPDNIMDVYYHPRFCSWGWGIWRDRWTGINWNDYVPDRYLKNTGPDLPRMLELQRQGRIDSWAVRTALSAHKMGMPIVYPKLSKVDSIGFGTNATHSKHSPNWPAIMDATERSSFNFDFVRLNYDLIKQFNYYFSIPYKIKNRIRSFL